MAFLNGQESPTIETAQADFDVLGVQMLGYHEFGVALQDPSVPKVVKTQFMWERGGVKSTYRRPQEWLPPFNVSEAQESVTWCRSSIPGRA